MPDSTSQPASSFQRVVRDVMDLFELQMELISVDSQAARRKLIHAIVCGVAAAVLAGSALTVAMIALGYLLDEATELSTGISLLIVSVVFFVIVALLGWTAMRAVRAAAAAMSETKSEFAETLRWLKATLVAPHTSARNQLRRDSFNVSTSASYRDTSEPSDFDSIPVRSPLPRR